MQDINENNGEILEEDQPFIPEQRRFSVGSGHSSRSLGRELQFGEVRQNITSEEISKAWCDFCIDMLFLMFIFALLEISMKVNDRSGLPIECGIPILMWHDVFFTIFGVRSLTNLLKIYVLNNYYSRRN